MGCVNNSKGFGLGLFLLHVRNISAIIIKVVNFFFFFLQFGVVAARETGEGGIILGLFVTPPSRMNFSEFENVVRFYCLTY